MRHGQECETADMSMDTKEKGPEDRDMNELYHLVIDAKEKPAVDIEKGCPGRTPGERGSMSSRRAV